MTRQGRGRWMGIGATTLAMALCANAFAADVVIIAHPASSTPSLSKGDVQDMFTGRKTRWANGATAVPVLVEVEATHEAFLAAFVQKTPAQFDTWWKRQVFTGKASAPRSLRTEREVVELVARTAGAIGYVSKGSVTDAVRTVTIQ